MIPGIVIVALGTLFLLRNLGVIEFDAGFWSVLYPLILIGIGISLIYAAREWRRYVQWFRKIFGIDKKKDI